MVTPFPSYPQPQRSANIPATSGAIVINIGEANNYPGGGSGVGQAGAAGGQGAYPPANYNNLSFTPQQLLYNKYNDAMRAREDYIHTAQGLENQAQQQQQAYANPYFQQGWGQTPQPYNPYAAYGQPMPQQQQPQPYPMPIGYPPYGMNQGMPPMPGPQQPPYQLPPAPDGSQPMPPVDQAPPPAEQPPAPEPEVSLKNASNEELLQMIENPSRDSESQKKRSFAIEEAAIRGNASPKMFNLLKSEATRDTRGLEGQELIDANYLRQNALWGLGMLNKSQNAKTPAKELPGLKIIGDILSNKDEDPDVQAAAVQSLMVLDRAKDKPIKNLLKQAKKSKNPGIRELADKALKGETVPLGGPQASNLELE